MSSEIRLTVTGIYVNIVYISIVDERAFWEVRMVTIIYSSMSFLFPIVFIIVGLIFRFRPPKNISNRIGYRSPRSTSSPEAWKTAHILMGGYYILLGISIAVISGAFLLSALIESHYVFYISLGLGVVGMMSIKSLVENKLREKSGD